MVAVARPPQPSLRAFVETVWASECGASTGGVDLMLPSASPSVVFRLGAEPLVVVGDGRPETFTGAVVSGAREGPYLRSTPTAGRTVGAVVRPGGVRALLGVPGAEVAGRHTSLDDLWGGAVEQVADRLAGAVTLDGLARLFEDVLLERLHDVALHPAVALALERLPSSTVTSVVRDSGYSHRCLAHTFTRATGLSPKRYARVARFERTLRVWHDRPGIRLAELAYLSGYSDQAHLTREFHGFAGITPREYAASAIVGSRHVPRRGEAVSGGQVRSRQTPEMAPG